MHTNQHQRGQPFLQEFLVGVNRRGPLREHSGQISSLLLLCISAPKSLEPRRNPPTRRQAISCYSDDAAERGDARTRMHIAARCGDAAAAVPTALVSPHTPAQQCMRSTPPQAVVAISCCCCCCGFLLSPANQRPVQRFLCCCCRLRGAGAAAARGALSLLLAVLLAARLMRPRARASSCRRSCPETRS